MKRLISFTVAGIFLLMMAGASFAERLQVWGSTTCQKRFLEPGAKAFKEKTGITLKVVGVGTGKGLIALIEGKTSISAASEDLEGAIHSARKAAKKLGKSITIPDNLQYHEIARDVIVPIVHKENPIQSLTWQQLKDINTGKIKNWKELGGPDLPIRVVTSHAGSATRAVFQKLVMDKDEYVSDAVKVKSTRLEVQEVSKYKGAIGAVSEGFVKLNPGKTKVVKTDTISRPLGLITIGKPEGAAKKLIEFFRSEEGKKYIK
ncbi:MAG: phosphate ABC transporter substrate-binding protein [Nitrospirae bacterium]|nr:MAG: phosphate ABC transporter substrate-binding protein [Nitrospirota bacterium]